MARHTHRRGDHLEFGLWLAFSADGEVRMTRGEPGLAPNERAMSLTIRVPIALFRTPSLRAEIEIPTATDPSGIITADVRSAAEAALKQAIGVDVVLTVNDGDGS